MMRQDQKEDLSEKIYIAKRKAKACIHALAYCACRIFPIDQDKIVMWTFEGTGGYGSQICGRGDLKKKQGRKNKL